MVFSSALHSLRSKSDEELAALVQEGDEQSMAVLAARMMPTVKAFASRMATALLEYDDLVQEGMLGLLSAARHYRSSENAAFRTYASVCVRNRMQSALRSASYGRQIPENSYVSLDEDGISLRDPSKTPEERFDDNEEVTRALALIRERLSALESEILRQYLNGLSYEQISSEVNVSVKSVDNALQRIRRKLRKEEVLFK